MSLSGASGLVSVIIPTYRRPREVCVAVESALAQTWPEIEVIVVSDGPDAETRTALGRFGSRVRYIEMPRNVGPAEARNAGVAATRGEWLTFLDDDDAMLPRKVEAQMRLADGSAPKRMISCRTIYRRHGRDDVWPARPIGRDEDLADYILRRPSFMGRPGVIAIQSLLIHRSLAEQIPFAAHRDHEDWAWLLEVWHRLGARVEFAWEPLVVYNIATESMSRSRRVNWEDSLSWARAYRGWIGDRAFCSFLATKAALKAKRAADRAGLKQIAAEVMRSRPGLFDVAFLAAILLLPRALLQRMWKRSLRSGEGSATGTAADALPST